ncbi:MAG: TonB-dependent receptor [Saprospiraceae bacterium]|nr:TonB-dependent receptor [Saprospiraceae bacterium]
MKNAALLLLLILPMAIFSQDRSLKGQLLDPDDGPVVFANVVLYAAADSSMAKVETTDDSGNFKFSGLEANDYFLSASYVGLSELNVDDIDLINESSIDLGAVRFASNAVELEAAVVTANRAIVEVKPDRTVFNVQGTINSSGDNGLGLLRKAPGVLVDNNQNITVLGRSGVMIYVDGKRLPLGGADLTAYLENLTAEQIDKIDIITNPGAKYEAEGNAGIIDIRLKKDKSLGTNGSVSSTISQGRRTRGNVNLSGNHRNKFMNSFGLLGYSNRNGWQEITFRNLQNGFDMQELTTFDSGSRSYNFRWGTDFFVAENHIIGFLVSGQTQSGENNSNNRNEIASFGSTSIDSILIAENNSESDRDNSTYNLNYRFDNGKQSLNIDLDYGRYRNDAMNSQPNDYYDPMETMITSQSLNTTDTPVEIDISTFKVDYETDALGGKLGFGTKLSKVTTDNTFLFYDVVDGLSTRNDFKSNQFDYDEMVYAGYINYNRSLGERWSFTSGLRLEQTDATGELMAFIEDLNEPPVELNYLSAFPNIGLTYQLAPEHVFNLNYGRRINRPDYNVLNPFKFQISELSFSKGNPFLQPEIVNNMELGYTLNYRYNFKLSYSKTLDQITRLIGPDDSDPRAGFINWDNLAEQTVIAFNISAPVQFSNKWNAYFNVNANFKDNQADYGDGVIVDLQAWSYNIYQQHTFNLPKGFRAEISGWFSGPGIWGGVFEYDTSWSLNLGVQKKFFNDQMNVRLAADDIFFQTGWSGFSEFDGLRGEGAGNWDSQRVTLSVSYNFGNQEVKRSRNRSTGLEEESSRVN